MSENLSENDRLRDFVAALAGKIGLDEERRRALDIAASLLGVGRLPVVDIMAKKGARSPEEVARMRDIPEIWADFTDQLAPLKALGVPDIVQAYCENWDGSGYPKGIAGEEIPLGARVLAVCYHYNGMISDRAHRAALPHDQAAEEIRRMSGRMLDPSLVETFIAMVEEKRKSARMIAARQAEEAPPGGSSGPNSAPFDHPSSRPRPGLAERPPQGSAANGSATEKPGTGTSAGPVRSAPSVAETGAGEAKVGKKPVSARKALRKKSARKKAATKRAAKKVKKKSATKKAARKTKKVVKKKPAKKRGAKKRAAVKKRVKKQAAKKVVTKKAVKKVKRKKTTAKKKK